MARCPRRASTFCWPARSAFPPWSCSSTSATWSTIPNCWNWSSWSCANCSSRYGFPGDDIPIVRGASKPAYDNPKDPEATKCIQELLDAIDSYIPEPVREVDKPFLMAVEDVFSIEGRGTVATGRIERGIVKVGDEVECIGLTEKPRKTTCTGVEMFNKTLDQGQAGDNVGILLRGIKREEIERGQVLAKPGSITPHTKFEAEVYVLSNTYLYEVEEEDERLLWTLDSR